jgi:ribose/xylose/arabinose/galactoside ABC-type transport system permease subunit
MNAPFLFGVRPPVLFVALAFLLGWIVLARLPIGPRLYALGGDPRMLRQAGVDERATATAALILVGCFTAIGMVVMLGRLGDGRLRPGARRHRGGHHWGRIVSRRRGAAQGYGNRRGVSGCAQ